MDKVYFSFPKPRGVIALGALDGRPDRDPRTGSFIPPGAADDAPATMQKAYGKPITGSPIPGKQTRPATGSKLKKVLTLLAQSR